jgi:hypothetical protein
MQDVVPQGSKFLPKIMERKSMTQVKLVMKCLGYQLWQELFFLHKTKNFWFIIRIICETLFTWTKGLGQPEHIKLTSIIPDIKEFLTKKVGSKLDCRGGLCIYHAN